MLKSYVFVLSGPHQCSSSEPYVGVCNLFISHQGCRPDPVAVIEAPGPGGGWAGSCTFEFVPDGEGW